MTVEEIVDKLDKDVDARITSILADPYTAALHGLFTDYVEQLEGQVAMLKYVWDEPETCEITIRAYKEYANLALAAREALLVDDTQNNT